MGGGGALHTLYLTPCPPLTQGVVITDFDQQYQNPYYQSEQDLPLYVLVRACGWGGKGGGSMLLILVEGVVGGGMLLVYDLRRE